MKKLLLLSSLFSILVISNSYCLDSDYATLGYEIATKDTFATLAGGTLHIKNTSSTEITLKGYDEDGNETASIGITPGQTTMQTFSGRQDYTIKCFSNGSQVACNANVAFANRCPNNDNSQCVKNEALKLD